MNVGDIVLWRDANFNVNRAWKIEACILGAEDHESLIRLRPMFERAGRDEDGKIQETILVPEVLLRGLEMFPNRAANG